MAWEGFSGVVAWVACQRGWHGWRDCVGFVLALVVWMACLRGWHARVGGVGSLLV